MSGSLYTIQPYSPDPALQMRISVIGVQLNSSATIGVRFFSGSGSCVSYKELVCEGEDYSNWGNDDEYLVNFVCGKLGVVIIPPAPAIVEPVVEPVVEPSP